MRILAILAGIFFAQPGLAADAAQVVVIGGGSGMLDFPAAQEKLKLKAGDTLLISAGTYSGLSLGNLAGTADAPITVKCDPKTIFTSLGGGENAFSNIAFVRFEGFRIDNGAMWVITGASHDLVFKNFTITNARGWSFRPYDRNKVFDGTKESAFYNFKWEGCAFGSDDGTMSGGAISNTDWEPVSNMKSVLLDFEISHCTFKRFDHGKGPGTVLGMDRCFNLQVHDCAFSDIGVSKLIIGHNVVIGGSGYYKIYNNTFTRQWANCVRIFPVKLNALGYDGKDAVTRYYNNISWEKRKYPDFEQNAVRADDLAKSKYLARTGSEIYFNTQYRSRKGTMTADPYVGTLVDVYSPDVVIKYNLVIDPECDLPFDAARNYVYQLGTGPQPGVVVEGNRVYKTLAEAGLVDAVNFVPSKSSPVLDAVSGRVDFIATDHYGNERYVGAGADVGAVERQKEMVATTVPAVVEAKPAWAADSGKDQYGVWADLTINGTTQRMRWIAAGTFTMGSPKDEVDRDKDEVQHQVTFSKGFWLGDTEVTQAFYQAVMKAEPSRVKGDGQHPIDTVSWNDGVKFYARLNEMKPGLGAAFPTEAQWEYACRAGAGPTDVGLDAAAWYVANSKAEAHPVRRKQPNAWGLYDMLGNMWELCGDYYGEYPAGSVTDPTGPAAGHMRTERGGSFNSAAGSCRAGWRWGSEPNAMRNNLGLRLAIQPVASAAH